MPSPKPKLHVALLRGINVGGSGILPMSALKALCESLGFEQVRTFIQSGNVIFESGLTGDALAKKLGTALTNKLGKPIPVAIRTPEELVLVLKKNPFPTADNAKVGVMFFAHPVERGFLSGVSTSTGEEVRVQEREVYIHYPNGMGRTKLKLPRQAEVGTVRNINTIQKIVTLCQAGQAS